LVGSTEPAGSWTVQSGIFPENTIGLHLHAKASFRAIGTCHHIGQHHGHWRDVICI
jgi:L-amino acid N-acyltransferase YncA